jgi:hypothetical protein
MGRFGGHDGHGDVIAEVGKLKKQASGDLLIWGHTAWPRLCCDTGWSIRSTCPSIQC